jgi:hypothetical protein
MRSRCIGLAILLTLLMTGTTRADRLFATSNSINLGLIEIDPQTGTVINVLEDKPRAVWDGLAFDGAHLWFLGIDTDKLFKLDSTTGATIDTYVLPHSSFRTGLAYLNGLLYTLDWSVLTQDITVIDPADGSIVSNLDVDGVNAGAPQLGNRGLEAITGPDALLLPTAFGKEILEINPTTGVITGRFTHVQNEDVLGIAAVNGEIYLANNVGDDIYVYNRSGDHLRMITVASVPGTNGFQSLAGDDAAVIPEPSAVCLLLSGAVVAFGWTQYCRNRRRK